jgi:hypothetical protein
MEKKPFSSTVFNLMIPYVLILVCVKVINVR